MRALYPRPPALVKHATPTAHNKTNKSKVYPSNFPSMTVLKSNLFLTTSATSLKIISNERVKVITPHMRLIAGLRPKVLLALICKFFPSATEAKLIRDVIAMKAYALSFLLYSVFSSFAEVEFAMFNVAAAVQQRAI